MAKPNPFTKIVFRSLSFEGMDNREYYIQTPHGSLFFLALRITLFAFVGYIFSVHYLIALILLPLYGVCFYLYYKLWLILKRHHFKLFPVVLCLVFLNIPFLAASFFVRSLFFAIFF